MLPLTESRELALVRASGVSALDMANSMEPRMVGRILECRIELQVDVDQEVEQELEEGGDEPEVDAEGEFWKNRCWQRRSGCLDRRARRTDIFDCAARLHLTSIPFSAASLAAYQPPSSKLILFLI